jgi:CRISPR-associated endonuclease/helicase Cas3
MARFADLAKQGDVNSLLSEPQKYLAHTPDETLNDHMQLVTHYFLKLIEVHGLEALINGLLLQIDRDDKTLARFAKKLFWETILYHDFGKVNENFQRVKMKNMVNFTESKNNGIDTQHSVLSAYIFLIHQLSEGMIVAQKEGLQDQREIIMLIFAFSHNIIRHHSSKLDDLSGPGIFEKFKTEMCEQLEVYLKYYDKPFHPELPRMLASARKQVKFKELAFEWFALIRLNFSLLTAADYYATSHYCNKWKDHYREFGTLTHEQRQKHFSKLQHTHKHNQELYQKHEKILTHPLDNFQARSNKNLNELRSRMAAEVIANVRKNSSERLFYIEAPTGGGKTNMAFIATMELLEANPELNKVFYVFPFTTLVTQTMEAAEETLKLENEEYIELHSRAAWKQKELKEGNHDGLYGEARLDDIHNQFVNYPYTFLSHVRFFDILKANDKSSIYLLHRLANSVVVIDEVQAYNPELWDKMAYLLKEYAQTLNIRFIVMSATLPKIGDLAAADFYYLIPDAIKRFFVNPNFADRVNFSEDLLFRKRPEKGNEEERTNYLNWLAKAIHQRSEDYRQTNGHVRTIVEFIFKKSATEFAALAEEVFDGYEVYVLSGTILEPRRKRIIRELKSKSSQQMNVLLITTQVVEAGVDIDMDLGFKNRSIIDSEEQLAGRVNRNVNKQGCTVYLFDLDDATVIYGKDLRYKEIKSSLEKEYFEILETKRFDVLYDRVKVWLGKTNQERRLAGTGRDYQDRLIGQLNFPAIDKEFTLIEHSNTSVFVPLDLPVEIFLEKEEAIQVFTEQQLQFLKELGVSVCNRKLSGTKVFELYKQLITDRSEGFADRKRNLRMMQSIMSMFTFSLFSESKLVKELISGGNSEEYGYLYLVRHQTIYDYEKGLLDQKFRELIFL